MKAANTRSCVPFALALQRRATEECATTVNKHMLKVVESLDVLYNVLYSGECFLSADELRNVEHNLLRLGQNYGRLSALAAESGEQMWRMTPKLHYAVGHLSEQVLLVNPRFVQTYGSESLVGKIAAVYKNSQDGPFAAGLQRKVLTKYRLGLLLLFAR